MLNKYFAFFALTLILGCASSSATTDGENVYAYSNYEVVCTDVGMEGIQTMVVASFGRGTDDALSHARRNAVHAILFKGIQSSVCNVPALVNLQTYSTNEAFFRSFMGSNGGYLDFISVAGDVPLDQVYVGRKSVKVFSQVAVNRNGLRSYLVELGVLSQMGDVFERKSN